MPAFAVVATVSVRVEDPEPGAAIVAVLSAAVTPEGSPDTLRLSAEAKPPETEVEMVLVPVTGLVPRVAVMDAGETEIAKAGGALIVRLIDAVCVIPPPVPVTTTV